MSQFVSRLETHQGFLNFYFNLIYTQHGARFHVSTVARDKKAITFHMLNDRGNWKLVDPKTCPNWIVELEKRFSNEIIKHLTGND